MKKAVVPKGYVRLEVRSSIYEKHSFFIDAMLPSQVAAQLVALIKTISHEKEYKPAPSPKE